MLELLSLETLLSLLSVGDLTVGLTEVEGLEHSLDTLENTILREVFSFESLSSKSLDPFLFLLTLYLVRFGPLFLLLFSFGLRASGEQLLEEPFC